MSNYINIVFYEDNDIKVMLEELDGHLMAHLTIYRPSKRSLKLAKTIWKDIKQRAYLQGYENIYTYTSEPRMLNLFKGGKVIGGYEYKGKKYEVIQWELK